MTEPWTGQSGWHVARWGAWGWSETVVKMIGVVTAVFAAVTAVAGDRPSSNQLCYWLVVAAAVGYVFTVGDRLLDRELVSLAFVLAMLLGHWSMVFAMSRGEWLAVEARVFTGSMLLGDLIKIGFFVVTGARVRNLPRVLPIVFTAGLAFAYLVAFLAA